MNNKDINIFAVLTMWCILTAIIAFSLGFMVGYNDY